LAGQGLVTFCALDGDVAFRADGRLVAFCDVALAAPEVALAALVTLLDTGEVAFCEAPPAVVLVAFSDVDVALSPGIAAQHP
jgi:hypothetical protein